MLPALIVRVATETEVEEFRAAQIVEYASQKVRAGQWPERESLARAERDVRGLLSPGFEARGHVVLAGLDETGERAGWVWLGPDPDGSEASYLFQITVEPARRGKGLGRGLLAATEEALVRGGARELRLNVFRFNAPALALYRAMGYRVVEEDEHALRLAKGLR